MRYTFAQLLELQNELNKKVDFDKVDLIVDNLLALLERGVKTWPNAKKFSFSCIDFNGERPELSFKELTQSELALIKEDFEALGFKNITIERNNSYFYSVSFTFSWE